MQRASRRGLVSNEHTSTTLHANYNTTPNTNDTNPTCRFAQALCPAQRTAGARPALGQPRVGGGGGRGEARPPWAGTGAGSGAGLVAGSGPLAGTGGGQRGGRGGDVRGRVDPR